jgi:hypothetical protein
VTNRFARRYELSSGDLQRLMNLIVAEAGPDEARAVERLLGTLTTAAASARETIAFSAPRGTSHLVDGALAVMEQSERHHARAQRARNRT